MSTVSARPVGSLATRLSFGCLGLQAAWVLLCYLYVAQTPPENWLAGLAGLLGAAFVVCPLAAVGCLLGFAARRTGWGLLALALNALAFLLAGIPLLLFFWPTGGVVVGLCFPAADLPLVACPPPV